MNSVNFLITHQFLGPVRYEMQGLSLDEAHRMIGANAMAGFTPVVHTRTPDGELLRTRDGHILTVVALHGSSVAGVVAFEQV